MKKGIVILSVLVALPSALFAAYDDATLTTDAILSVNGITINVTSSSATIESITTDTTSFNVTLATNSTITVTSASSASFGTSGSGFNRTLTCSGDNSVLTLTNTLVTTVTVTVTVSSTACGGTTTTTTSSGGSGGISGGGGGGGGGSRVTTPPPPKTSTTTPPAPPAPAPATPPSPSASPSLPSLAASLGLSVAFNRVLDVGASSEAVARLQALLALDTSVYPEAKITGFFGSLTKKAVERFQQKYGIAGPGAAGFGTFGPKTRAKLAEVYGGGTPGAAPSAPPSAPTPAPTTPGGALTRSLARGVSHGDVAQLQILLNLDVDTRVAESGPGSPGSESNYFGALTEKAVQMFQEKHGIAGSGDPGYGYVGPKTRAKLNSLIGGQ